MSLQNTDFLKFSASSIKDYITKKLSENSKFTDQVYEGSNITILIDIVSYMYQCMMYQLNNAASESMWSDTQIYENISRLARILGYSPRGIVPSQGEFYIDNTDDDGSSGKYGELPIPPYAKIDTTKVDSNGRPIYFSTREKFNISRGQSTIKQTFYNGQWKLYPTINTATGDEYETFILDGIGSDTENGLLVGDKFVDVYVKSNGTFEPWTLVDDELFMCTKSQYENNGNNDQTEIKIGQIYDGTQKVFNLRLNENKIYEIKFGNGIVGKKLNKGDEIYVFYMETNGEEGKIDANDVPSDGVVLLYGPEHLNMTEETYKKIFGEDIVIRNDIIINQNLPTSTVTVEENSQQIRENAPIWFKVGRRLVTAQDYKYFLMNMIGDSNIIDCVVQNNWEYIGTFYKWLYNLGLQNHGNQRYYLNETKLIKGGYQYSDAADATNIYIWTKLEKKTIDAFQQDMQNKIQGMKTMTSEVIFLKPITVYFAVTSAPEDTVKEYIGQYDEFDPLEESYIEVELDNNSIYVTSEVQQRMNDIINDFFDQRKLTIGCTMNYQDLMTRLYGINGMKRIRTVYQKKKPDGEIDTNYVPIIKDGISFVTWSEGGIIEEGDDIDSSNIMKTLQPFQFPQLKTAELRSRIKVIKKSINNVNKITY